MRAMQIAHAWPLNISSPNTEANQLLLQYTLVRTTPTSGCYVRLFRPPFGMGWKIEAESEACSK